MEDSPCVGGLIVLLTSSLAGVYTFRMFSAGSMSIPEVRDTLLAEDDNLESIRMITICVVGPNCVTEVLTGLIIFVSNYRILKRVTKS